MLFGLIDKGVIPYWLLRAAVWLNCAGRLYQQRSRNLPDYREKGGFITSIQSQAIADVPEKANEQHYEVPPRFFELSLGKRLKYSAAYWDKTTNDLDRAEERMLALYAERAQLSDGLKILELGCGWGSLTLYMAERFPQSCITAVSNSTPQRRYIEAQAQKRGLTNIEIITQDMNVFVPPGSYDRIVSIEMFEHMRNWRVLFERLYAWLNPGGKMFLHIFTHRTYAYPYSDEGATDWMAKFFFSGGMMPSDDLPLHFLGNLRLDEHWMLDGTHYEKTARAWVQNMDTNRQAIITTFNDTYGLGSGPVWFERWRLFYLACEVLFGFKGGSEWGVSHYRFVKPVA